MDGKKVSKQNGGQPRSEEVLNGGKPRSEEVPGIWQHAANGHALSHCRRHMTR
jgi:hypothetical protein